MSRIKHIAFFLPLSYVCYVVSITTKLQLSIPSMCGAESFSGRVSILPNDTWPSLVAPLQSIIAKTMELVRT